MTLRARALAGTVFFSIAAMAIAGVYACGSDEGAADVPDAAADTESGATSGGLDAGGTPVGDGSSPGTSSCTSFADAATVNESIGSATLKGSDVDGTFCARVSVRKGSYNHQSPSDLVLELHGIPNSYAFASPSSVGGDLLVYVGLNTTSAGASASTDPSQCGTIVAGPLLTPTADEEAHCAEDAGTSCPYGCFSVNHAPCKPIPTEVAYQASLTGNCLGEILKPQGSWKVTITSLEPKTFGPPYTAHGTLEGVLLERGDGGPAGTPANLTITF